MTDPARPTPAPARVAIIGCGGVATRFHAPACLRLPEVELVAGCDLSAERAAAFARTFGCRAGTDYRRLLQGERPDLVIVSTREHEHVEPAIAALEAGAHVLSEKVMAHTLEGGRRMLAAAARTGRRLGVVYEYRFFPLFAALKRLLDAGELGEVGLIAIAAPAPSFHHMIDLIRWLGGPVETVAGRYTATTDPRHHFPARCPDFLYVPSRNAAVTLGFASGALGVLTSTAFRQPHGAMQRVEVVGEQGSLTADGMTPHDIIGRLTRDGDHPVPFYEGEPRGFDLAFEHALRAFVAHARGAQNEAATGDDGYAAMQIEAAIVRSQAEGHRITLAAGGTGGTGETEASA